MIQQTAVRPAPMDVVRRLRNFDDKDYWYIDFLIGMNLSVAASFITSTFGMIEQIRTGQVTLFLNNNMEAFHNVVDYIYRVFVINLEIPPEYIILMSESATIDEEVRSTANRYDTGLIQVEWVRVFEEWMRDIELDALYKTSLVQEPMPTLEIKPYEKKFLSLNRRWRAHRPVLVALLKVYGLLDQGYVSLGESDDHRNWSTFWESFMSYVECMDEEDRHRLFEHKDEISNLPLMYLDTTDLIADRGFLTDSTDFYYANTYFSVITETNFYIWHGHGVFLSEKIFKPVIKKHPFIVLAAPYTLAKLRHIGYKTFDGIVDESYDSEINDFKRMSMIVREIKRLCNLDSAQLERFLTIAKDICEHNYELIRNRKNEEYVVKLL